MQTTPHAHAAGAIAPPNERAPIPGPDRGPEAKQIERTNATRQEPASKAEVIRRHRVYVEGRGHAFASGLSLESPKTYRAWDRALRMSPGTMQAFFESGGRL